MFPVLLGLKKVNKKPNMKEKLFYMKEKLF